MEREYRIKAVIAIGKESLNRDLVSDRICDGKNWLSCSLEDVVSHDFVEGGRDKRLK